MARKALQPLAGGIFLAHAVDKPQPPRTFRQLAAPKKRRDAIQLRAVFLTAAQKQLTAADGLAQLILLGIEHVLQILRRGDAHEIGNVFDGKAEVFKPQAVHQEVDVPRIVIAVVVVGVLIWRHNAFFFIVSQQVRRYAQNPCHVADLVSHVISPLLIIMQVTFVGKCFL